MTTVDRMPRSRRRRVAVLVLLLFVGWWVVGGVGAWLATRPHASKVPTWTELSAHTIEVVTATAGGVSLRGWLVDASGGKRCVVLAAGIHGNRLAMVDRARWYLEHGWSALLVDLRGTGESSPERITMGWNEALDLIAWRSLLDARGFRRIGVHGQSLGAAAAVFTAVRTSPPPAWDFVVLEACYRDLRAALSARLPLVPSMLTWPMLVCGEWLLGVDIDQLCPLRAIHQMTAPTLIVGGADDQKVGPQATRLLFEASPAVDKRCVVVPGAGHVDLWRCGDVLPSALGEFLAGR